MSFARTTAGLVAALATALVGAGELCCSRRLWARRALAYSRCFHFRSARVRCAPGARTPVLEVHVRAGRGHPLPHGLATVFLTLGRVGSPVGGRLVTAVSTSPQPSRKGSL
jgi:hypothetical protein